MPIKFDFGAYNEKIREHTHIKLAKHADFLNIVQNKNTDLPKQLAIEENEDEKDDSTKYDAFERQHEHYWKQPLSFGKTAVTDMNQYGKFL